MILNMHLWAACRRTDRQTERGRQTGHASGGESCILWGLIDSILWANDLPWALGRNDETSLHDTVTLPVVLPPSSLSLFFPFFPLALCFPLSLSLSFPGGNASIHLCLYCHLHTLSCHGEELSSPKWWNWFGVIGVRCPHFPKNETKQHPFSFSSFEMTNAWDVCRRCLKVTGGMAENR